jgi:uncharacterized repeat protein (TIGR01451 family)
MAVAALTLGLFGWFLVLEGLQAQGPITTLGINHQCNDPLLKEEPLNDTYQAAAGLQAGQPQIHTLDSGGNLGTHDKDWFVFSLAAGQVFTLSTTIPATSVLTMTEISLFTSTTGAQSDNPAASSLSGQLGWSAALSPATQLMWARVRNQFAAGQEPANNFCDALYEVTLKYPGNLDNADTLKLAATGPNRTLTYTVALSNVGELIEPVTVTDTLPAGVNLLAVTISPASVTTALLTTTISFTWTGLAPGYSNVQFTLNTTVSTEAGSLRNTVWILAGNVISRTSEEVTFAPGTNGNLYLPIILKG